MAAVWSGKKILIGITGSIAAYKTTYLIRYFVKQGARVKVIMTNHAEEFVTPLTLSTLSKNPVLSSFVDKGEKGSLWNNHVTLGLWANIMLIAPATSNTLSKMAAGICDNLLLATYFSARCPVYFAPAMDLDMYKHSAIQRTFATLKKAGNIIIPATYGELASGLIGEGRMAEPEAIATFIANDMAKELPLKDQRVLITAGPTYESIDPVRFIGNHASGMMGFQLARTAATLGAEVVLITGPTHLEESHDFIKTVRVTTAEEMYTAVHENYATTHIAILAAAVADYKPKTTSRKKIKKKETSLSIVLEPTKDILASLGAVKKHQFIVGFALETDHELEHAMQKLKAKNLDAIVLNSLNDEGAGFGTPTNKITYIAKDLKTKTFALKSKKDVANDIFDQILKQRNA